MSAAYSLEARLALMSALQPEFTQSDAVEFAQVVADILDRLDTGGWCITTQHHADSRSAREEENRHYHYQPGRSGASDMDEIITKLDFIAEDVTRIDVFISKVTELVETQFGVVIEP